MPEGGPQIPLMDDPDIVKKLNALDEALFPDPAAGNMLTGGRPKNALLAFVAPFDISRPNIHDSKAEFSREKEAVESSIQSCERLLSSMWGSKAKSSPEHQEMTLRLREAVDAAAARRRHTQKPDTVSELILGNAVDTGISRNFLFLLFELRASLVDRLTELEDQEKAFWSVSNRPPNYYARAIALRFARHFARKRQSKPTFGTERGTWSSPLRVVHQLG